MSVIVVDASVGVKWFVPEVHAADIPVMYVEMDGTGVPVVASETEGRVGKIEGQSARTREAKLGCVFTQTATDDQGRPVRDEDSTTYTGAIETAELFGRRLYAEAHHRGWNRAKRKVVFVYRVEGLVKSGDFDKAVDKSREFRYLKLDEWERVQRICQS